MIRPISVAEALPVRRSVLWPGHPLDHARVPGDNAARHFGWFDGGDLMAVGSLFQDGSSVQLRKFAALPEVQGRGIGTALLSHMVAECRGSGASLLWCDSRLEAMDSMRGWVSPPLAVHLKNAAAPITGCSCNCAERIFRVCFSSDPGLTGTGVARVCCLLWPGFRRARFQAGPGSGGPGFTQVWN